MTEQEFDKTKWRLVLCRSIDDRHYEVYECSDIPDLTCTKRVYLKDDKTERKEVVNYKIFGATFLTKEELLNALEGESYEYLKEISNDRSGI